MNESHPVRLGFGQLCQQSVRLKMGTLGHEEIGVHVIKHRWQILQCGGQVPRYTQPFTLSLDNEAVAGHARHMHIVICGDPKDAVIVEGAGLDQPKLYTVTLPP